MVVKSVSVNPLKTSPAIGASYALHGIENALSLFHAAPGCTFLGKVLLTQVTKEPVGVVGTDIKEIATIMDGGELLEEKILSHYKKFKPSLIGVIATALSEVRGEDIESSVRSLINKNSTENTELLYINTPDYIGGFSEGYAKTVETIIDKLVEPSIDEIADQINIIPSGSMTIAEIDEIKELVSAFGLKSIVLPDISRSIDGSKNHYSNLPFDGTTMDDIKCFSKSAATIVIGESMSKVTRLLSDKLDMPLFPIEIPVGLSASDHLITILMDISGNQPTEIIKRWRNRLIDAMADTHLLMADKEISLGLEKDDIMGLIPFINELGIKLRVAIASTSSSKKFEIDSSIGIKVGDLEDLEILGSDSDLLISNSHAKEASKRLGIPLLRMGFPITDSFGEQYRSRIGYKGSLQFLFEIARYFNGTIK